MKKGLISVVIPIYNVEKYLDRCLESVVAQTYQQLEILLIDDGSPDHCPEMCEEWAKKDKRIRVIHKKNQGLGMARNTGIEHANGEYICFFDSDDYVALDTIEKAYHHATRENVQIVLFGATRVNRSGEIVERYEPITPAVTYRSDDIQTKLLPDLLSGGHSQAKNKNLSMSAWAALFSMELIRNTGWRFVSEREIISEDSYSLMRLYKDVQSLAILPEVCYYYCENENSLTRSYREDRFDKCKDYYWKCLDLAQEMNYCEEVRKSISGAFVSFTIAAMKQIVAADISLKQKRMKLKQIVLDDIFKLAINQIRDRDYGIARKILTWTISRGNSDLCYLLIMGQNLRKK